MFRFLALSLAISLALVSGVAQAQSETPATEAPTAEALTAETTLAEPSRGRALRIELLDNLLEMNSKRVRRERRLAGWTGILGGAVGFGVGTWRLVGNNDSNEFWRGLGVAIMSLGAANIAVGAVALARIPQEEERHARWSRLAKSDITDRDIAQFEGEMRAAAYIREGERKVVRWTGLAQGVAGIAILSLTPIPDLNSESRRSGFIIGGVYTALGFLAFGMSFRKTASEVAWERYERVTGLSVSPQVGKGYGGASLSGRF